MPLAQGCSLYPDFALVLLHLFAAPHSYLWSRWSWPSATCTGSGFSSISGHKAPIWTCGDHHPLQLALVVPLLAPTGANTPLALCGGGSCTYICVVAVVVVLYVVVWWWWMQWRWLFPLVNFPCRTTFSETHCTIPTFLYFLWSSISTFVRFNPPRKPCKHGSHILACTGSTIFHHNVFYSLLFSVRMSLGSTIIGLPFVQPCPYVYNTKNSIQFNSTQFNQLYLPLL